MFPYIDKFLSLIIKKNNINNNMTYHLHLNLIRPSFHLLLMKKKKRFYIIQSQNSVKMSHLTQNLLEY